jgi:hypothetical protein
MMVGEVPNYGVDSEWSDNKMSFGNNLEPIYTVSCAWHKFANALRASLETFSVGPLALNALNPSYHSNGSCSWLQVAPGLVSSPHSSFIVELRKRVINEFHSINIHEAPSGST